MSNISFQRYKGIVHRWLWLIVLTTLIGCLGGYFVARSLPKSWVSSTTLVVGSTIQNPTPRGDEFATIQMLASIYSEMAQQEPILQATVDELSLAIPWSALAAQVLASHRPGTQYIDVRVVDTNPLQAKRIAESVAKQLIAASPSNASLKERQDRERFVKEQLESLSEQIQRGMDEIADKQEALSKETSARGVAERQDEIRALQLNISNWQSTYATLLNSNQASGPNTISIRNAAYVPSSPSGPNVSAIVMMTTLTGFLLALAASFFMDFLEDAVRSREDVERMLHVRLFGAVTKIENVPDGQSCVVTKLDASDPSVEGFKALRSSVLKSFPDANLKTLLITSACPGEGKSTIAANLALTLAKAGKRVLLVDADLQKPSQHQIFGISNGLGLADWLVSDSVPLDSYIVETGTCGLRLLPSGSLLEGGATELGSAHLEDRVKAIGELAEVVILDGPPALVSADVAYLSSLVDGVLLVVAAASTRAAQCRQAIDILNRIQAKLLGVVLNKASAEQIPYYGYSYGHYRHPTRSLNFQKAVLKFQKAVSVTSIRKIFRLK